ncbi:GNAT family N-acetyltransferase [Nocardioidaceae bacterium]|nr:GNAT family N-acetyltransferase [Nocardioidaceae bacterium]
MSEREAHQVSLRPAGAHDQVLLGHVLRLAADPSGPGLTYEQVLTDPALARYVAEWPRTGDTGVVAETPDGRPVGAAWARTFPLTDRGHGFVSPAVPELSMAVGPDWRGMGWGGALLDALLAALRTAGVGSVSLSVRDTNAAARALYDARGFAPVGHQGESTTMLLVL